MARVSKRVRRAIEDLLHGDEVEELESGLGTAAHRVFRARVALAIVLVSILSAAAGWRASVFDERASDGGAVYYQDLLLQQRLERSHEASVAQDIIQYGEFEQDWFLAHAMSSDPQASEQYRVAAEQTLHNFQVAVPTTGANGASSYDPARAYAADVAADTGLVALHPEQVLHRSDIVRGQALNMTAVAALFIAALVLLTLAQVTLGRRARAAPARAVGNRPMDWSISHTFLAGGTLVTLVAAVLFVLVMVQ